MSEEVKRLLPSGDTQFLLIAHDRKDKIVFTISAAKIWNNIEQDPVGDIDYFHEHEYRWEKIVKDKGLTELRKYWKNYIIIGWRLEKDTAKDVLE
jgi:hypothetical protein